jgi:tetratricopeptide (TPR) repeat protein
VGRRLGLLIGINHYQDSTFQPLNYAETDATMFARWLGNARGGNWSPSDIFTLTGARVTTEKVESLVAQLCLNAADPGDLILIYFAGHAFIDAASGDGMLACADTSSYQPATALHLPSLIPQVMVPGRAAQIVLLLDCFQTGASSYDFRPLIGQSSMMALQETQGRLLYCSCRGNDLAPESGEQGFGSFMYRVIVGLSGPAVDAATGRATLQQLHVYLSASLAPQHRPQVFGQDARPIMLAGEAPAYAGAAPRTTTSSRHAAAPSLSSSPSYPAGQITFQGVGDSGPLVAPSTPSRLRSAAATGQLSPSTSGPISISQVEQNYQQQCDRLMQQARQQVAAQNLPEALQIVEQVLRMAPTFPDALTLKTQILGTSGRLPEAIATTEQLLQKDPTNALAWSMYAALLTNTGRLQEALAAIEQALAIQPDNPESLAMRQAIVSGLPAHLSSLPAGAQRRHPYVDRPAKRESITSFLASAGLQLLAFMLGLLGAAILVLRPSLPIMLGLLLESFGLAALCVLAARGSFRYGIGRALFTLVLCLAATAILGGLYRFEYNTLVHKIIAFPPLIVPVVFLGAWLIAAAALPLLAAIGGLAGGVAVGVRRRRGAR